MSSGKTKLIMAKPSLSTKTVPPKIGKWSGTPKGDILKGN